MKSSMLKKAIISAAMLGSIGSQAAFTSIINNAAAPINPKAELSGPVYRHETKAEDKYGDEVAKIIFEEAHKRAKAYLEEGNTDAYYAFMILAFAVPRQESLYVQFSEVPADKDNCRDGLAVGEKIKNTESFATQDVFREIFNNQKPLPKELQKKPGFFSGRDKKDEHKRKVEAHHANNEKLAMSGFLMPCSKMSGNEKTHRRLMAGGWDGSDVGFMQVSVRWHSEKYMRPQKFKSVRESVNYGVNYLYPNFDKAIGRYSRPDYVANPEARWACYTDASGNVNYQAAIQGTWAAYNGGPGARCRFTKMDDPNNDFAGHDKGFLKSIKTVTDLNKGRFFGFNEEGQLPISELTKNALAEMVNNYENKTNKREFLSQILGQ